jgi:hypothetical protein
LVEDFTDIGRERIMEPRNSGCEAGNEGRARHEFGVHGRAKEFRKFDQFGMTAALRHGIARP